MEQMSVPADGPHAGGHPAPTTTVLPGTQTDTSITTTTVTTIPGGPQAPHFHQPSRNPSSTSTTNGGGGGGDDQFPLFRFVGDNPLSSSSSAGSPMGSQHEGGPTSTSSTPSSHTSSTTTPSVATSTKPWKLFVGQVPKNATEAAIRNIFAPYGDIVQLNILRDKMTQISRGCAFVTFSNKEAADQAIAALHNVICIPPHNSPIQVRYADEELQQLTEHKLFIGKLPPSATEDTLRQIFAPYGTIEQINILRGPADVNCAFVKYENRDQALNAIKILNGRVVLRGSSEPLVVKFADTKKQKDKKVQMQAAKQFSFPTPLATLPGAWPPPPTYPEISAPPPSIHNPGMDVNSYIAQLQSQIAILQNALTSAGLPIPWGGGTPAPYTSPVQPQPIYHHAPPPIIQTIVPQPSPILSVARPPILAPPVHSTMVSAPAPPVSSSSGEGPPGANLFIYHLPTHFTDTDLYAHFSPYGQLVSAKVFIDKATGMSKCFGFVSYATPQAAEIAIQQMNGYQIAGKRLRVQLKRARSQPY